MSLRFVSQITQQVFLGNTVRENHALEHATIALLSKKFPETRLAGVSIAPGFFIFGDVPESSILTTAEEALSLLRGSEPFLAIHERCGTNLAVAGFMTGSAALLVSKLPKPFNTFNNVILASTSALLFARPVGMLAQRYLTTHTPNESMRIVSVHRLMWLGKPAHFVVTDNPGVAGFLR